MLSNVISEDMQKSSVPGLESIVSVLISNYPLANGGYLVSFGKDDPEASFTKYDPVSSLDFEASKLSKFLDFSSIFLPQGCFYSPDTYRDWETDRKSTRLNSSHSGESRMPSSA